MLFWITVFIIAQVAQFAGAIYLIPFYNKLVNRSPAILDRDKSNWIFDYNNSLFVGLVPVVGTFILFIVIPSLFIILIMNVCQSSKFEDSSHLIENMLKLR